MVKKNDYELAKDFSGCIESIHREAEERITKCRKAYDVIRTLKPLLPKGWYLEYQSHGTMYVSKPEAKEDEKNSPIEFRTVCQHVERITGLKMNREVRDWGSLTLHAGVWVKDGAYSIYVDLGSPNCKVTYEEREIAAHTEKRAVVPDACLGKQM